MFGYAPEICERFPTIRGGAALVRGADNGPSPAPLVAVYRAEQQAMRSRIGATPLSEIASLAAWRQAFRAFGVDPTKYRSAAEALLRRLTKKGDIPSINLLVDIGNFISVRHAVPVAVFDLAGFAGSLTVRTARGDESFTDLGAVEPVHPDPGEVVFADEDAVVAARRWCWRQSEQSAARHGTTDVLVTVESHHDNGETVTAALDDLGRLAAVYVPGAELSTSVLSPAAPLWAHTGI